MSRTAVEGPVGIRCTLKNDGRSSTTSPWSSQSTATMSSALNVSVYTSVIQIPQLELNNIPGVKVSLIQFAKCVKLYTA